MLAGQIGARGQIRTDTGDALDVVPLLVGLHEQTPPAGLDYRLGSRRAGPFERRALGGVKMVGVPGNAPGLGTDLVRCGI
jgi:hypothetical protein